MYKFVVKLRFLYSSITNLSNPPQYVVNYMTAAFTTSYRTGVVVGQVECFSKAEENLFGWLCCTYVSSYSAGVVLQRWWCNSGR
jgi:hypothetical protein